MVGGYQIIFLGDSERGLNIYSNFSKVASKSIWNVRKISDCYIPFSEGSGKKYG